ncbi:MAG: glycosyltransferase [Paludibacteraceae bacterium]|nr:glycosyltransferase [Paludibacteraceae bacterium]
MVKLSFILPVYNVDRYLSECLDSIFIQDLDEKEYEVICVDDCSLDQSVDIIIKYQLKHSNLRLIRHDRNKKAGGARNTGIENAVGQYIWFVDPDDYISPKAASAIIKYCEDYDLDVFCFNLVITEPGREYVDKAFYSISLPEKGSAFLFHQFRSCIVHNLGYPWRAVYKRSIIERDNIKFIEDILFGEETTFMAEAILASERVLCVPDALYYYRQNSSSASAQLFEQMRGELIYQSIFVAGTLVLRLQKMADKQSRELSASIISGLPWFVNRLFMRLVKTSSRERKTFYLTLKNADNVIYNVNSPQSKELLSFMDKKNKFIILHPFLGNLLLSTLSILYRIKHIFMFG